MKISLKFLGFLISVFLFNLGGALRPSLGVKLCNSLKTYRLAPLESFFKTVPISLPKDTNPTDFLGFVPVDFCNQNRQKEVGLCGRDQMSVEHTLVEKFLPIRLNVSCSHDQCYKKLAEKDKEIAHLKGAILCQNYFCDMSFSFEMQRQCEMEKNLMVYNTDQNSLLLSNSEGVCHNCKEKLLEDLVEQKLQNDINNLKQQLLKAQLQLKQITLEREDEIYKVSYLYEKNYTMLEFLLKQERQQNKVLSEQLQNALVVSCIEDEANVTIKRLQDENSALICENRALKVELQGLEQEYAQEIKNVRDYWKHYYSV